MESPSHLSQIQLARRWSVSPRTLERWRWSGQGPTYVKAGRRVVYRLEDIEAYEARQDHTDGGRRGPARDGHGQA